MKTILYHLFCWSFVFLTSLNCCYGQHGSPDHDSIRINKLELRAEQCSDDQLPLILDSIEQIINSLENKAGISKRSLLRHKSRFLGNKGYLQENLGNVPEALKLYTKSLKFAEEVNDRAQMAICFQNLGSLYDSEQEYGEALNYYRKSYKIKEELKNDRGMGFSLNNIAYVFTMQGELDSSMVYYEKGLKIFSRINDTVNLILVENNIGYVYIQKKEYDKALKSFMNTIELRQRLGDKRGLIYSHINLSEIYFRKNNIGKAKEHAEQAYKMAKLHGRLTEVRNVTNLLKDIYASSGNYKQAYALYDEHIKARDSLFNEENKAGVVKQRLEYEHTKKLLEIKKKEEVEQARTEAESKKQRLITVFVALFLGLAIIFGIVMYNRFKVTTSQKKVIESQKHLVEEQQKEIRDSINYAKRIQSSFMASDEQLKKHLNDYFILFEPKDVVSGDFYWADTSGKQVYVCVADSTGHGIPGAFMSLLNISLLNEGKLSKHYSDTNELLDFVRRILILGLRSDESGQGGNDGMDCSLIRIDWDKMQLQFSGANNPLWLIRGASVISLDADKMPVGRSPRQDTPFTTKNIDLIKGDVIYMFTDGYPDQFGGPKGKKFKYKQLNDLLLEISTRSMEEQRNILKQKFVDWKGELDQVDDVCIIGIRI